MAGTYQENIYQGNHIAATDLQNIEDNFEFLRINFRGAGVPPALSGGLEGVIWWDSGQLLPKIRSNTGWRGIFTGSTSFKIWAYLDAAEDGWARDATMSDQVLALKGGAIYTTGAQYDKGTWTISGITVADHGRHNHPWYKSAGGAAGIDAATGTARSYSVGGALISWNKFVDMYTGDEDATQTHTPGHTPGWRIKASVGIMVYPDI